jgi:hypothetical protein
VAGSLVESSAKKRKRSNVAQTPAKEASQVDVKDASDVPAEDAAAASSARKKKIIKEKERTPSTRQTKKTPEECFR